MSLENSVIDCMGILPDLSNQALLQQCVFDNFPDPIVEAQASSSYTPELVFKRINWLQLQLSASHRAVFTTKEIEEFHRELKYLEGLRDRL